MRRPQGTSASPGWLLWAAADPLRHVVVERPVQTAWQAQRRGLWPELHGQALSTGQRWCLVPLLRLLTPLPHVLLCDTMYRRCAASRGRSVQATQCVHAQPDASPQRRRHSQHTRMRPPSTRDTTSASSVEMTSLTWHFAQPPEKRVCPSSARPGHTEHVPLRSQCTLPRRWAACRLQVPAGGPRLALRAPCL